MGIALLTSTTNAEIFPYARFTFNEDQLELWTLDRIEFHLKQTIGKFDENASVMEKDNAANPYLLEYISEEVEGISNKAIEENNEKGIFDPKAVTFQTELDLTKLNGLVNFAIHVDDIATLTVTEKLNGFEPTGYTPIAQTYHVKGTALWRLDRSYKEFTTPIPAGRKYDLKLNYQNTANLTKKYNGAIDYDGLNVFLLHQPNFDLAIASYGNEANLPEDRQANGEPLPTPHETNPGATVIAPIAGSDGENITPGKRAKLTLTCDGSQLGQGTYTLSADTSLTKLKIYDKEKGGDPITLPIQLPAWEFSSATKTYYVGSDAFHPNEKIQQGIITLTHQRHDDENKMIELKDQVKVTLTSIEVVQLAPLVRDEDGNTIPESAKPNWGRPITPFVEEDPYVNRIAHRELKVRIGSPAMSGKKVTWTLKELPGATPATIRGKWSDSPVKAHKNAFEESATFGKNDFKIKSGIEKDAKAETTVGPDGHTAIRVNVPPIGFNQVRIQIQIEGIDQPFNLIDMEVPAVVVIDPGHGGTAETDFVNSTWNNSKSPSGKLEKNMALDYGFELNQSLEKYAQAQRLNLKVMMTRDTDVSVNSRIRAGVAKDNGADQLFIIHFNAFIDDDPKPNRSHTARGSLEVRQKPDLPQSLPNDMKFIDTVLNKMVPAMQAFDSKCSRRDHYNKDTTVATDEYMGNDAKYYPVRAGYCEVDFIDYGMHTPNDPTDDAIDILLNLGPTKEPIRRAIADAMRDGIIEDLRNHTTL